MGKNDNAITLNKEAPSIDYRIKYSDAYGKGYNIGKGVEDKVKDKVGGLFKKEKWAILQNIDMEMKMQ